MNDPLLDQLFVDVKTSQAMPGGPLEPKSASSQWPNLSSSNPSKSKGQPIAKINYSHDGMIDLIIANPGISQNDIAAMVGYTASWVATIMASDAFQARLAERRDQIIDPLLKATVEEKFKGMVSRSLEILAEKLKAPPSEIPDNLALRTLELSARALGYGAKESLVTKVEINIGERLDQLGGNLDVLLRRKQLETNQSLAIEHKG